MRKDLFAWQQQKCSNQKFIGYLQSDIVKHTKVVAHSTP